MELFAASEPPATVVHPRKRSAVDPATGVDGNGLILVSQRLLPVCLSICLSRRCLSQYTLLSVLKGRSLDLVAYAFRRTTFALNMTFKSH